MLRVALFDLAWFPVAARAEVLDKEFSLWVVACWAVASAIGSFLAALHRPSLLALVVPVFGGFFVAHLSELLDPFVGPAIVAEGGLPYVLASWSGPALLVAGCALGFAARVRRGKVGT